jgi:GT2 family glycosyltransferase
MAGTVGIILINYNLPEETDRLFERIEEVVTYPKRILVLDNASDKAPLAASTNARTWVNTRTGGANITAAHILCNQYQDVEYLFFMHNDMWLESDDCPITPLVRAFESHPKIAAVHPVLQCGVTLGDEFLKRRQPQGTRLCPQNEQGHLIMDDVCPVLFSARAYWEAGGFDPRLTRMYGAGLDLYNRLHERGYQIAISDDVEIYHQCQYTYRKDVADETHASVDQHALQEMDLVFTEKFGASWRERFAREGVTEPPMSHHPIVVQEKSAPNSQPDIAANVEAVLSDGEMLLAFPHGRHHQFQKQPARVTVCVPVYNAARSLKRCLDSILSQTGVDVQVIVIDNGSTDTTFADACGFAARYPNVLVYQNPANIGRVPNWNRCLDLATGEFTKLMMVNDYLQPDALRQLADALDRSPSAVMACAAQYLHQSNGAATLSPVLQRSMVLPSATALEVGLTQFNPVAGPTVQMLRSSAVAAHRLRFDTDLEWASDYDFALRLLQQGDLAYVHEAGGVVDLTVPRFNTDSALILKCREDATVVLKCFRESGALAAGAHLEQTAARLQKDYNHYYGQARTQDQRDQLEQVFVSALEEFQQMITSQFLKAA